MSKRRSNTSSKAGDVRIIAGQFRGRRLPIVSVDGLRPTGDRVRETVFNWLQNEVPGARCLDAFAGTGALGFEAASRFAQSVTLVEANRQAAMALDQSKDLLQAGHLTIVNQRFEEFVASAPEPFDVVFVDPPFQHADFTAVLQAVDALLAVDGVVYLECPKSLPDSEALLPESWSTRRDKVFGDVRARLCERRS